nr:TetR/AcrR family transcriptional regulator [Hyphomonas sp. Mor2]
MEVTQTDRSFAEENDGRTRLIKTAMALFADRGIDGVTVRQIAAAAGVSVGLINHHFGSKEGLAEEVDKYFLSVFDDFPGVSDSERPFLFETPHSELIDVWMADRQDNADDLFAYFKRSLLDERELGAKLFDRMYTSIQEALTKLDAHGELRDDADRLWLPFLVIYLELGTALLRPQVERILGKPVFEKELWARRHRAYGALMRHGFTRQGDQ